MEIIERIFMILKEKNIKSVEISKKLGINQSVISTWKSRKKNPPAEYLIQICEVLNVSIEYLLTGKEIINENMLTLEEQELLNKYRKLNDRYKGKLETYAEVYIKEQNEKEQEQNKSSNSSTGELKSSALKNTS